jgi:hypothetical protein
MTINHHLLCDAPICRDDPNPGYKNEVVARPGEKVCQKGPYLKFQKVQIDINNCVKDGTFRNMEQAYTANDLETRSI